MYSFHGPVFGVLMRIVSGLLRLPVQILCAILAKLYLWLWGIQFGSGLVLKSFPICRRSGGARIRLGSNVTISNKISENLVGISHRTVLAAVGEKAELLIGDRVGISGAILFSTCSITIEDYVNIGVGVKIYDTDFHPTEAMARRVHDTSQIKAAPVRICRDVWLGAEAMVLKGVTVGARSIVAARAVVVKDVPEDCIVAGVPAQIVSRLTRRDTAKQSAEPGSN